MGVLTKLLAPDEQVVHRSRQHWLITVSRVAAWTLGAVALVYLRQRLALLDAGARTRFDPPPALVGLIRMALLVGFGAIGVQIIAELIRHWRTQFVITTQRVVYLTGILRTLMADAGLWQINDVLLYQSTPGRILGYGDIEILTASERGSLRFRWMRKPLLWGQTLQAARGSYTTQSTIEPELQPMVEPIGTDVYTALDRLNDLCNRGVITPGEFEEKKHELLSRI